MLQPRKMMRWLNDVSTDLRKMGINEWRDTAGDREAWRRIVMEAKAHPGCSAVEEEEEGYCIMSRKVYVYIVLGCDFVQTDLKTHLSLKWRKLFVLKRC
jgi:hypothetical protein